MDTWMSCWRKGAATSTSWRRCSGCQACGSAVVGGVMPLAPLIAELAERVCEDRHPVDGVYELAVMALDELARETDPRRASAYFLMAALDLLGYSPQVGACASCDRPLTPKPAAFSPE